MTNTEAKRPLATPTNLTSNAVQDLAGALTTLLADMFAIPRSSLRPMPSPSGSAS